MEFDDINIIRVIAISAPHLAQTMSNTRRVLIERFKSDPGIFRTQMWMNRANAHLRTKTIEHFQRQLYNFDWNINLNTEDAPVLPVAHGTSFKKACKIIVGGFAKLNTLDDGFHGRAYLRRLSKSLCGDSSKWHAF